MKIFIKEITAGMEFKSAFLIARKAKSSQNEKQFSMWLSDCTGSILASCYDAQTELSVGDVIECRARAVELNGKLQLEIDPSSIRKLSPDEVKANLLDFVPKCEKDVNEMMAELQKYIDGVGNQHLRSLLENFFSDKEFVTAFCLAPAAILHHHNYAGGLVEHTLSVTKICDAIAMENRELDRDLLIAGALLHDVGKIKEYAWTPRAEVTGVGGLLGHAVLGVVAIDERCPRDFPEDMRLKLHHMIVSHHGKGEWGAAVTPRFAEAAALHYAECLDAKVKEFISIERKAEAGSEGEWCFSSQLGRYIYLGKRK